MVMSKKVKMQKTIEELLEEALVPEEEQPYEVPENWVWVRIGEIVKFIGGGTPSKSNPDYWNGHIPWASVKDFKTNYIGKTKDTISQEGLNNSSSTIADENELLLITRMSPGKSAITRIKTAINQDLKIVRPKIRIPPYLLWIYFAINISRIEAISTGSTVKGIRLERLNELTFPLPPINEQRRIANKVERLLNKIDEAKQLIEEAKETFELRRAAILDKAFRGELTAKWREDNPELISNNKLVEKIEEAQFNIKKKSVSYQEIIDTPYELPNGWIWVSLDMVAEKITDGTHHSPKSFTEGDYKYVTAKNIKEDSISLDNITYVPEEVHREIYNRCNVKKGDVLYIKDGATTGVATINTLDEEFSLLSSVGVIRTFQNILHPRFLKFCLNSPRTKERMLGMMSGNAIRRLTLTKINQAIIPLPSIEEQKVIIKILEKIDGFDQKIKVCTDNEVIINNMKQSILSKAFRGELGTNNPTEESALELLKEVLQEQLP
jgi:type I restriction enzyme S subunit